MATKTITQHKIATFVSFLYLMNICVCFLRPLGTTFKGKYGCVDYWVKAFLDRPSFPAQEIKKHFEVMDQIDVNTPDLMVIIILGYGFHLAAGLAANQLCKVYCSKFIVLNWPSFRIFLVADPELSAKMLVFLKSLA